jgi:hypothetical protein
MTTTLDPPATTASLPPLDEQPRRAGPVTRRLLRRTALVVALVEATGIVLLLVGGRTASIIGASALIPGGGLLYTARPVLFLLTAAAVVLAIVMWWAISASWGIPAVWIASAIAALALADTPNPFADPGTTWGWAIAVNAIIAAACALAIVGSFERRYRRKRSVVPELNAYLATAQVPEPSAPLREPDDTDAELLRWCHELALQPLDRFEGFEWGEQFHGGTCVRYQLNYLGWALSQFAVNYVPNAPNTIEHVLRNLVLKQTDLRVWSYWRTLNTIGNWNRDPDPLVHDNIMFSGFTGDQINMYEAATGSTRFDEPGSLTFVWKDGTEYAYDHHSWIEAVRRNFDESQMGFFPCEPGWAFAACNTIGAQALLGYEVLHGRPVWSEYEPRWRDTLLQEYLMPDGNYANIRCTRTGLSWDTGETPGGEYLTTGTNQFRDVAPDLAARGRALATRGLPGKLAGLSALIGDDGELQLELPTEWERNRARKTALTAWTKLIAGARMVGDERLASAAQRAADRQCRTDDRWPQRPVAAGVQTLAVHLIVRWATPLDTGDLNLRGYVAPTGPLLDDAPWPQVLVAKARSLDGRSLDLTLYRHELAAGDTVRLGFAQLTPHARYRFGDQTVVVDASGCATAEITLDDGANRCSLVPEDTA